MKTKFELVIDDFSLGTHDSDNRITSIATNNYAVIDAILYDYDFIGWGTAQKTDVHQISGPVYTYTFFRRDNCSAILIAHLD